MLGCFLLHLRLILQVKAKAIVMMMRSRSSGRLPPDPFVVIDDKGGEEWMIKAQLSPVQSVWQIRCHRISKTGGTGFDCWMQQAFVIKFES